MLNQIKHKTIKKSPLDYLNKEEKEFYDSLCIEDKETYYAVLYLHIRKNKEIPDIKEWYESGFLMPFAEIARQLNIPYKHVQKTYYEAIAKIKSHPNLQHLKDYIEFK